MVLCNCIVPGFPVSRLQPAGLGRGDKSKIYWCGKLYQDVPGPIIFQIHLEFYFAGRSLCIYTAPRFHDFGAGTGRWCPRREFLQERLFCSCHNLRHDHCAFVAENLSSVLWPVKYGTGSCGAGRPPEGMAGRPGDRAACLLCTYGLAIYRISHAVVLFRSEIHFTGNH